MFFVFLWEREKQLDALFDGHAFNHSAGCQVDGCSDVPGMGMGSGQQTGVKLITGYKGGKRCAKCGNFSSISSNKHVNNGQKRVCSEEALVSTQGAANCIKWLINSSKALAINGGTAAETGRVVCFLLRKLCSSVFRLS